MDPRKIEAVIGREVAKFPLMFAATLFFASRPRRGQTIDVNNGTLALLDLKHRQIGITCFHVLEVYRQKREHDPHLGCYLGLLAFDPLPRVIDQDPQLDLVTLDLSGLNLKYISDNPEIGSYFFCPSFWPCSEVKEGDFVTFGGFPGLLRTPLNFRDLLFGSFSCAGCRVASVHEDHIVCQFESREDWVVFKYRGVPIEELPEEGRLDLGGLSGAPVFVLRPLHLEFVGIIYEYSMTYGLLYIRPFKFIRTDGCINRASMSTAWNQ